MLDKVAGTIVSGILFYFQNISGKPQEQAEPMQETAATADEAGPQSAKESRQYDYVIAAR